MDSAAVEGNLKENLAPEVEGLGYPGTKLLLIRLKLRGVLGQVS